MTAPIPRVSVNEIIHARQDVYRVSCSLASGIIVRIFERIYIQKCGYS